MTQVQMEIQVQLQSIKNMKKTIYLFLLSLVLNACSQKPDHATGIDQYPDIFPAYQGVTIPAGIAPLNFNMEQDCDAIYVEVKGSKGGTLTASGKFADFDIDDWHALTKQNIGGELFFTVYTKNEGKWLKYKDFNVTVSPYELSDYGLTYRKIAPGYETASKIGDYQRNIHTFQEDPIIESTMVPGQCMSCHTNNRTNPDQFTFHLRGSHGGTFIQVDGNLRYLATKTENTCANVSYCYWHPSGNYIAFSANKIHQSFWVAKERNIEVYDSASDINILDVRTNQLILSKNLATADYETYPVFSADGKTLYFCTAQYHPVPAEAEQIKYSLCKTSFDEKTGNYGTEVDTLLNATILDKSITFPRPSYDGKYLMYNVSDFGNFPINHKESDLWIMDMKTGESRAIQEVNSPYTESFHNWSSDSHWFVFASRRGDGLYSNLYLASIDEQGKISKPFLLPQKNPKQYYSETRYSFNVPDFTCKRVELNTREAYDLVFNQEKIQVTDRWTK